MADMFLSYRRDDSRGATGRLADRLQTLFGPERVLRNVDSIAPGLDFEAALARAIGGASVMLAMIGPRWADLRDAQGRRRLDDPQDTVRREIEAALAAGLPVISVLVEGARMPTAEALPASLEAFTRCQAFGLDDAGWHVDVARLAAQLHQRHGIDPSGSAGVVQQGGKRAARNGRTAGTAAPRHPAAGRVRWPRCLASRHAAAPGQPGAGQATDRTADGAGF
jgi:hypothetical protein